MSSKYRTTLNVKRLTEFRHDLHMHPELKFMEHRTSDKIAAFLTELDIPYKRGLASTGIVGSIYGKNRSANDPGPAIQDIPGNDGISTVFHRLVDIAEILVRWNHTAFRECRTNST